jgi:hypothetical protein
MGTDMEDTRINIMENITKNMAMDMVMEVMEEIIMNIMETSITDERKGILKC